MGIFKIWQGIAGGGGWEVEKTMCFETKPKMGALKPSQENWVTTNLDIVTYSDSAQFWTARGNFRVSYYLRMELSWFRTAVDVMENQAPKQQMCARVCVCACAAFWDLTEDSLILPTLALYIEWGSVSLPNCHSHRRWWLHFPVNFRPLKIEPALSPLFWAAKFPKRFSEGEIIIFSSPQTGVEDFSLSRKCTMHHALVVNTNTVLSKAALPKSIFIWDQKAQATVVDGGITNLPAHLVPLSLAQTLQPHWHLTVSQTQFKALTPGLQGYGFWDYHI